MRPSVILGAVLLTSSLAPSTFGAEPTKERCIAAHVAGQDLRRSGKLSGAIDTFEFCAATSCPAVVREDCERRLIEAQRARPTVVFVGKTPESEHVAKLRIGVDGAAPRNLAEAPITVETGEHRFYLVAEGFAPVTKRLTLLEGMHVREEIVFARRLPAAHERSEDAAASSPQRTVAYVVGGVGIASLVGALAFEISARGTYSEAKEARCDGDDPACQRGTAATMVDEARGERTTAYVFGAVGAVMLVGAVVLWLTAPSNTPTNTASTTRRGRWFEFD